MRLRSTMAALAAATTLVTVVGVSGIADAGAKGVPTAQLCSGDRYGPATPYGPFDWGTVTVGVDRIGYDIGDGYEVRLCVKGGPSITTATLTGPVTGELLTAVQKNGKQAALSQWSVVSATTVGP